jgi:hypothetical protein
LRLNVRIGRRHVIFLQGYDPRGRAAYYRTFRGELRKFGALYGLAPRISRPETSSDQLVTTWTIDTENEDCHTHTVYDFLRWEDLVQRDRDVPAWRTIAHAVAIYSWLFVRGIVARFIKAHWRFAAFITYPYVALLAEMLLAGVAGFGVYAALTALGSPIVAAAGLAALAFAGMFAALVIKGEPSTYMLYLMADTIFTYRFAHRKRPDWDERITRFAHHLVEVARSTDADELIVVGHSSGSFLGVEIIARALAIDPDLGRRHARVALLTVGGNLPIIGFLPVSAAFRDHLRRLATEPSIDWVDCQSRKDVMNFFPFDPIAGHGIDVGTARRNPRVVIVRLRDLIAPARYNLFRWQFFRVHFQFVMANDRANAYDFFMIVCGPVPLAARMARPHQALTIATGDAGARAAAWKALQAPDPA